MTATVSHCNDVEDVAESRATRYLAELLVGIQYENLEAEVIQKAKSALLDQVGCLLIGSTLPWTRIISDYVISRGGVGRSRVVNYGAQLPPHAAAMVNAVFGQGCEWDDYTTRGWGAGHAGAAAVPAGLAVGENDGATGKQLVTSIVVGYEAMSRVGKALRPGSDIRHFHVHGMLSPYGSVATAGHLLGLDADHMQMAIGIAASHASGTMEYDQTGGEIKRLHSGIGARAGVDAAYLSQLGLTAPPTILEGRRGVLAAFADKSQPEELTKPLEMYSILESGYKLYPCVATILSSIEAAKNLMAAQPIDPRQVAKVVVRINPGSKLHGGTIYRPTDVSSAQFSLPFSIAIRLALGSNDLVQYMDESLWTDELVLDLADRVESIGDESFAGDTRHASDMTITMKDGSEVNTYVRNPKGSFMAPITDAELDEKFRSVAGRVVDDAVVDKIIDVVDRIDQLDDVSTLVDLLCTTAG